jgi:hypothetical protein
MLAFGIGLLAIAALLRRRLWLAVGLVAAAAAVHVTTALWFAVVVGVAILTLDRRWRRTVLPILAVGVVGAGWAFGGGILAGRLQSMDAVWLQAVASKDSLFATQWPVSAWIANLGLLAVLWAAHIYRRRHRAASSEEGALVWGATALVALFLVTLPFVSAGVAFFVQLQIPRVFWLVDAVATVVVVGAVARPWERATQTAVLLAIVLGLVTTGRGLFVMLVERPERSLFAVHLPADPWQDAMAWVARQDRAAHVLADPGHAWKFGTSVRVSGQRDVLIEEVKDSALAIYSRDVATRVVERTEAVGDFSTLTPERARELAMRYDLDYLVTVAEMPMLPQVYQNPQFRVYSLADAVSR